MRIETWLPVFPGFYNTIFEADESPEIDDINSQRQSLELPEISYDDCEWNYPEYRERIAEGCCEAIEDKLKEMFPNQKELDIEYQSVYSPREYNFTNNHINIAIEIDVNEIIVALKEYEEEFEKYIHEKYKRRDGFIPFYSNDYRDWFTMLANGEKYEHIIGEVLEFLLELEEYKQMDLYDAIADRTYISATNYGELTTK